MARPNQEFLEKLLNYESSTLVRRRYKEFHGGSLADCKAREIASSFAQARHFLDAATAADRAVRPLLVYYGVLAYARAVILFRTIRLREAGLENAHGLSAVGWGDELSKDGGRVENLRIKIGERGTFRELMTATGHISFLRANSSKPNLRIACPIPPADTEISLGDLALRIPEVQSFSQLWLEEEVLIRISQVTSPALHKSLGTTSVFRVQSSLSDEKVAEILGEGWTMVENQPPGLWSSNDGLLRWPSDCVGPFDVGDLTVSKELPGPVGFSKMTSAFLASYALGMLVRYYPTKWSDMLFNRRHDESLPTILALLRHVEEDMPRLMFEFLEEPVKATEAPRPAA